MVDREALLKTLNDSLFSFGSASQTLIDRLTTQFRHGSQSSFIKEKELEKVRRKFNRVRSALKSANDLPIFDAFDQHWMGELTDLQRCAEDVLEEIEFASFRASQLEDFNSELNNYKDRKRKRQEVCLLFSSFPSECLDSKIESMMKRYDEIAADRRDLRLSEEDGLRRGCSRKQLVSTSLPTGELCGREKDFDDIKLFLCDNSSDDYSNRSFGSICIVGMPGVGKTALVQHLYHDQTVQNHFDNRFWICASQDFDAGNITKTIIQGFGEDTRDIRELNLLQEKLILLLTGKRVLLVLDDVWVSDENRDLVKENWEKLEASLNWATKGSKVIVTTQNMNVRNVVKAAHVHNLICLPDEICWLISKRRAFEGRNTSTCSSLEPVSREIVIKKCKGLPLVAKVIGDFLHSVADEEKWLDVLHTKLWSNDQLLSEILSPLQVVYDRLMPFLKRCYGYCSLFPKGYEFQKEQLIRLWIGQEFVEEQTYLRREEVGEKYFDELVSRYIFQKLPMDGAGVKRYVMHDLFHESIQSIALECCRIEGHKLCDLHEKFRHLSLVPPCLDLEKTIEFQLPNKKDLQSLLLIIRRTECKSEHESFRTNVSPDLFSFVKSLRALDLSYTNIKEIPSSVNHLIHLRYLVLKKTKLQRLPESICGLFKLQTLDLKHCYSLTELPWGIKHLFNLRHLELPMPKCSSVYIPPGIGKLLNLIELPIFFVTSDSQSCRIGELNNLDNLENELHILGLQNICYKEEAEKAKLVNKKKLKGLTLQWPISPCSTEMQPSESSYMVLEGLQPSENLEHLTIRGFCGSKLPKWVGERRFTKLDTITLEDCQNCDELPPLGQLQFLKHLLIQNLPKLINVGPEFCRGTAQELDQTFPLLETLEFKMMVALEKWDGVQNGDLPRLQTLTIMQCNKLKTLPQLNSVKTLHVEHSPQLHELPLLPSLQHMHIYSDCPLLLQ